MIALKIVLSSMKGGDDDDEIQEAKNGDAEGGRIWRSYYSIIQAK